MIKIVNLTLEVRLETSDAEDWGKFRSKDAVKAIEAALHELAKKSGAYPVKVEVRYERSRFGYEGDEDYVSP